MSTVDLEGYIERMQEWEVIAEEAKAEADAIRDKVKAEMLARDTEELEAGRYIVRWTPVLSSRFDTASFKKQYGDLYQSFTKQVTSRRFSVAA